MPGSVYHHLTDDRVQLCIVVAGLPTITASPGTQMVIGVCALAVVVVAGRRNVAGRAARPRDR